jgi:N-acetylglucosaminyl-diphospho-decaprenol L-rhamnosyltransferase
LSGDPRVTTVILTHNRAGEVARTVERVLTLSRPVRVIVVDNGSTDGAAALLAARFPAIDIVSLPANIGAAGRNAGVTQADTPYVALCDDDTWWAPGSLARAADLLDAYPRLAIVVGHILVGPDRRPDPTCARMAASPLLRSGAVPGVPILGFMAGASVVRRSAFLAAGGFDRHLFLGGEEMLLAMDLATAGWAMAYVPEVVVHHCPSAHRDARARTRLLARNALWLAWLRRPALSAARETLRVLRWIAADGTLRPALGDALRGLSWVARHRRVVPPDVERVLRSIEP